MVWTCWGGAACVPRAVVQWRAGPVTHSGGGGGHGGALAGAGLSLPGGGMGVVSWSSGHACGCRLGACLGWLRGLQLEGREAGCIPPTPVGVGLGRRLRVRRASGSCGPDDSLLSPRSPWTLRAPLGRGSGYRAAGSAVASSGGAPGRPSPMSPGACVCGAGGAGGHVCEPGVPRAGRRSGGYTWGGFGPCADAVGVTGPHPVGRCRELPSPHWLAGVWVWAQVESVPTQELAAWFPLSAGVGSRRGRGAFSRRGRPAGGCRVAHAGSVLHHMRARTAPPPPGMDGI